MNKGHNYWVVLVTFIVALMLTAMPLPEGVTVWRPAWVAMVVIYWSMALPQRVSIGTAWVLGILLDVMQGSLLGQHAIGLAIVAYVTAKLHLQIRQHPLYQQSLFVGLMVAVYLCLVVWVNGVNGRPPQSWAFLTPVMTSMLLWPWLFVILRDVRRRARIS
jgi:rod shape-determining protein MreD